MLQPRPRVHEAAGFPAHLPDRLYVQDSVPEGLPLIPERFQHTMQIDLTDCLHQERIEEKDVWLVPPSDC